MTTSQNESPIQSIDHRERDQEIYHLFQKSYKIEADLAKADKFPPLLWTSEMIRQRPGLFFGIFDGDLLIACIEVRESENTECLIASLVVDPKYFKQGLASRLLKFSLERFHQPVFYVETAAANHPAIALYQKFGFVQIKEYVADLNIPKVRLILKRI